MLAIVDDEQELFGAHGGRDTVARHGARAQREAERGGDGGGDELRAGQGPELGDEHAVGKSREKVSGDLQAQSRLADAPGADQGDQPMLGNQVHGVSELGLPADQLRNGLGKVRRRREHRRGGRGRRRADLARELIATPGHCPDEVAIGAEDLSQCGNLRLEDVLLDDPVGPHAADEVVLAEDRAVSVDEGHQRVERPPAQLDRPAIDQQLAAVAGRP